MSDEIPSKQAFFRAKKLAYLANVTLNKLCDEAGVEASTVWRWQKDHTTPSAATLQKLEDASARLKKDNPFLGAAE